MMLFDDMAMLTNLFSVDGNDAIPLTVDEAVRVASGITSVIAENLPTLSDIAGVSVDGVAASGAGVSGLQGVSPSGYSVSIDPTTGLSTVQPFDPASDNILFQGGNDLFDNPLPIEGKKTVKAIGEALTADHMEKHGRQFFPEDSEADFNEVLGFALQEMRAQLARPNSGVGWYSKDVALALMETEKLLPRGVHT
jgi:hypothetical protein